MPFYDRDDQVVAYPEGHPLLEGPRSASYGGVRRIRFKHLGFNPTGSFKDYGMVTGVTPGQDPGDARRGLRQHLGNTSASMSAYAPAPA